MATKKKPQPEPTLTDLAARVIALEKGLTTLALRIGDVYAQLERQTRALADTASALVSDLRPFVPETSYEDALEKWDQEKAQVKP